MTYNVFSGTLNPTQSINQCQSRSLERLQLTAAELAVTRCLKLVFLSSYVGLSLEIAKS